jgi:hydrogenase-4 component F
MSYLLILLPLAMAALAFVLPSNRGRPWLLPVGALGHLGLVAVAIFQPGDGAVVSGLGGWLLLDPLGKVFLGFFSVFYFVCLSYTAVYLSHETRRSNRVFCSCLLLSLAMMTLVVLSHHLGLMWVGMEMTTLVMAPTIYFYHTARSLEATYKYLIICSVGIALALLGSFYLAYATLSAGLQSPLLFDELVTVAPRLSRTWLQAAFVFALVGYGTKMGLAPMHTWLPDAHGEAPASASALLSGAMLPCAFLAILRVYNICLAAGDAENARQMMVVLGLVSMATAAVFLIRQPDLKRMLAYSSVEHMGILAFGIGVGGRLGIIGSLLHVITHGLTKGGLFLAVGNIQHAYGSKLRDDVQGVLRRLRWTGPLFLAGFFAISGSPPFGPFLSEFTIAGAALGTRQFLAGALFLMLLGVVFVGMGATVLAVAQGPRPEPDPQDPAAGPAPFRDGLRTCGPVLGLMALVLLLGLYIPPPLESLLRDAAAFLEVKP